MNPETLTAKATIRIRRPPTKVFDAFASAEAMGQFWFTRRDSGLKAGETILFYIGDGDDAYRFDVHVRELRRPDRIVIAWENGGVETQVTWTLEEADDGSTILKIVESGFGGSPEQIVERALDSTGGFNQVVVAAKAYIEHGVSLNVVRDHA